MWDDHDIFDGWGSLMDRSAFDERVYRAAEAAFREYQQLRNPGGTLESRPPFGYSFWRGDVGFHVPDLRGERDFEKGRVMDRGWSLLDGFLAEATDRGVPTIFIGASVPVVHASPALMTALERLHDELGPRRARPMVRAHLRRRAHQAAGAALRLAVGARPTAR